MSNGPYRAGPTSCRAVSQIARPLQAVVPSGACIYRLRA